MDSETIDEVFPGIVELGIELKVTASKDTPQWDMPGPLLLMRPVTPHDDPPEVIAVLLDARDLMPAVIKRAAREYPDGMLWAMVTGDTYIQIVPRGVAGTLQHGDLENDFLTNPDTEVGMALSFVLFHMDGTTRSASAQYVWDEAGVAVFSETQMDEQMLAGGNIPEQMTRLFPNTTFTLEEMPNVDL